MFDLHFQGQSSSSCNWFWVFWDPRPCKCQNRHQDQVCSLYTAGDKKGHTMNVCDLEFQGQPWRSHDFLNIFDIYDLENVRIDTKINIVSCLQPEIRKVMQKGVWPWFSRSRNKDGIFSLSPLDSLTPKTYPWEILNIFEKFGREGKNPGGGYPPPPLGRPKVDFYLPWASEG